MKLNKWQTALLIIVTIIVLLFVTRVAFLAQEGHVEFNCKDFTTQKQAQKLFDKNEKDIYNLDGDNDNIACESLP